MTISPFKATKIICSLNDEGNINNLKLQKILYLLNINYMGLTKTPLINEEFEARKSGPVLYSVYEKMKVFGSRPIGDIFHGMSIDNDAPETKFIIKNFKEISEMTLWDLIVLTHLKGGAWEKNCSTEPNFKFKIISNSDIADEYESLHKRGLSKRPCKKNKKPIDIPEETKTAIINNIVDRDECNMRIERKLTIERHITSLKTFGLYSGALLTFFAITFTIIMLLIKLRLGMDNY